MRRGNKEKGECASVPWPYCDRLARLGTWSLALVVARNSAQDYWHAATGPRWRFSVLSFGDVLAMVAGLLAICICAWTTLVLFSLFFPGRSARAADSIRSSASKMGLRGFLIATVVIVAVIALASLDRKSVV